MEFSGMRKLMMQEKNELGDKSLKRMIYSEVIFGNLRHEVH
jgi:hypothetical protein